jgi:hypothetical protein
MNRDHFSRLQTLVAFEIDRFRETLKRLRASHFPSAVALQLIDELFYYLAEGEKSLPQIATDFAVDPEGASSRLQSEHRKLLGKFWYLEAIEDARTDSVPWSIIPSVERFAKELITDRQILATGTTEFNYGIRWNEGSPAGLDKFYILSLPKIHRANPFLHVLIGHEFFHPLLSGFLTKARKTVSEQVRQGCLDIFKSHDEVVEDLFTRRRLDQLVELTLEFWKKALEEIMCDLGCGAIFGPAAILSSSYFALSQNLDEQPSSEGQFYPPWRYRLRVLLKYVLDPNETNSALKSLQRVLVDAEVKDDWDRLSAQLKSIRELTLLREDLNAINENPFLKLAYDSVDKSLDAAWTYIESITAQLPGRWTNSIAQVPCLLKCLDSFVPPGEFRTPNEKLGVAAELTAMNLAGWLYLLRLGDSSSLADFHRICHLMLKAYEDSELKRAFAAAKQRI